MTASSTSFRNAAPTFLLGLAGLCHAQPIEVVHWWTSPAESKATRVLADAYQAAGGKWVDTAVAGMPVATKSIMARLASGGAPGAAMYPPGVRLKDLAKEGLLGDISDVAKSGNWATAVAPEMLRSVTEGGKVVAVPITLHGVNWMWYSPKVLKAAGVAAPTNWDETMAAAAKIKAAGYLPFAVSTQPWQVRWLYDNILLGVGGRAAYEQLTKADPNVFSTPAAMKALVLLAEIRAYADPGASNRNWNDTTNLVLTDKAAFQFMGDWAKGEFVAAGKKPNVDFGCALTPGAQNLYVMMGDALAFPASVKGDTPAAQRKLAAVAMDPQVQVKFALAKGSIPVRTDVPRDGFDACAAMAMKVVADPKAQVAGAAMAMASDASGAVTDTLAKYWATPDMKPDQAARALANALKAVR